MFIANPRRWALRALLLLAPFFAMPAHATIYYVAANGLDTNNGTSKTTAWLHAPGMSTCTNVCASTTPAAGDSIIFRGGDTWYKNGGTPAVGTWTWQWSGNGTSCNFVNAQTSTCIYIGVDQTYFSGVAWARPVLNWGNPLSTAPVAACTFVNNTGGSSQFLSFNSAANFVIMDNFEDKGFCEGLTSGGGAKVANIDGTWLTFENFYIHGWTRQTGTCLGGSGGTTYCDDNPNWYGPSSGSVLGPATHSTFFHNVMDGSDSPPDSGGEFCKYDCSIIYQNVINFSSNGIVAYNPVSVHDNVITNLQESWDLQSHGNVLEWTDSTLLPNHFVYNNVIHDNGLGVGIWDDSANSGTTADYYNNTIYHWEGPAGNCFLISSDLSSNNVAYSIYNNVLTSACKIQVSDDAHCPQGSLTFSNNQFIGYGTPGMLSSVVSVDSGCTIVPTEVGAPEIFQSVATAAAQGYVNSGTGQCANNTTPCAPTSGTNATVGAGTNYTSLCATFGAALCSGTTLGVTESNGNAIFPALTPVARPSSGAWDQGPYEFSSAPCSVTGASVSPSSASLIVDKTQQFTGTVIFTGNCAGTGTWSVTGGGSISSTGLYTAPGSPASGITVRFTSTDNTSISGTAAVTVTAVTYPNLDTHCKKDNGSTSAVSAGCPITVLAGDTIWAGCTVNAGAGTMTVSDGVNPGTYSNPIPMHENVPLTQLTGMFLQVASLGGTITPTCHWTVTQPYGAILTQAFTPQPGTTLVLDAPMVQQQDGTTANPTTGPAIAPSSSNEVVIGQLESDAVPTAGANYAITDANANGGQVAQYWIQTTPNATNSPWTQAVTNWTDQMLALRTPASSVLTVASTNPASGVAITVSPADQNGNSNGTTTFTRTYINGTAVTLTAPLTASGNAFVNWTGCGSTSGTSGSVCSISPNANATVTANYSSPPPTFTLTMDSMNPASGVVIAASPADNNSHTSVTTPGTLVYNGGTVVTLTAPTTAGTNPFANWSGCPSSSANVCSFTVNANITITANYTPPPPTFVLTLNSTDPASGVVIANSPADNNSNTSTTTPGSLTFNTGTAITLTAPTTVAGNTFSSWTNCPSAAANVCSVTLTANSTITANYVTTFTLTIESTDPTSGVAITVSPSDNNGNGNGSTVFTRVYTSGVMVTLVAPAIAAEIIS